MVDNVGGIEYTVGADTSQLLKSERDVDRASRGMEGSLNRVDTTTNKLSKSVKDANATLGGFGKNAGQAGIQIQQFVGQVQGGTSAMVALSQQAADLGIVLGAPLLGAVIGIAAAIGGTLFAAIGDTNTAIDESRDALSDLGDDYDDLVEKVGTLTEAQKEYIQLQAQNEIAKARVAIKELETGFIDAAAAVRRWEARVKIGAVGATKELEKARLEFASQRAIVDQLNTTIAENQKRIELVTGARKEETSAQEDARKETERAEESAQKLIERFEAQSIATSQSRAEAIRYSAAVKALALDNEDLANSLVAVAESAAQALEAQDEQRFRDRLSKQLDAVKASNNEKLKIEQEYQSQLKVIRDSANAGLIESEAAREKLEQDAADKRLERLKTLAEKSGEAAASIDKAFEDSLNKLGDNFANTFADAIVQGDSLSQSLRSVAQAFLTDVLASLIKVGAQMAINSALASAAQTTAAATGAATGAALATAYAPAAALASLASFGANAAPAQAGLASTLALSQSLATVPGLQLGGPIGAGQLRRVNENGPELFTDGARQFLLPDRAGTVVSNSDASGSGGSPVNINFNVTNNAQGSAFAVESVNQNETEITINAIISDIRNGGPVVRTLESETNVTRRANG